MCCYADKKCYSLYYVNNIVSCKEYFNVIMVKLSGKLMIKAKAHGQKKKQKTTVDTSVTVTRSVVDHPPFSLMDFSLEARL